jgi:hypothetical protein
MAVLAVFLAALAFGGMWGGVVTSAAPAAGPVAAPTPVVSAVADFPRTNVTMLAQTQIQTTTATAGTAYNLAKYDALDIQTTIDISDTQTVTVQLQYTNYTALTNWVDGVDVVSEATSDTDEMSQFYNFGQYTRIVATASTTNPVTVTVYAVAK